MRELWMWVERNPIVVLIAAVVVLAAIAWVIDWFALRAERRQAEESARRVDALRRRLAEDLADQVGERRRRRELLERR